MNFLLYQITNLTNGKIYVGTHITQDINDGYMGSGTVIKKAISKYGLASFKKDILFVFSSAEEMFSKEREIVNSDFLMRMDTYNIIEGGSGGWDFVNSTGRNLYGENGKNLQHQNDLAQIARKKKLSDPIWRSGYCKKISDRLKEVYTTREHPWKGKSHSVETKRKISEKNSVSQKGQRNSQFGSMWIHNPVTKQNTKIKTSEEIPLGWTKGRKYS